MLHTTAFGNIIHFISGRRWFCTLDKRHIGDVLKACGGEKVHSKNQYVDWVDETDPDNPKNWPFAYKCFVTFLVLSLIHISEPTRRLRGSRMPSSA